MNSPFPGGRRAAVSLTYDDCLPCHRLVVAPALAARGMRGTFYVPAASGDLHSNVDAWRAVAADGHELGNHSCFHPCRRIPDPPRPTPIYDLKRYERKRIADELLLADRVLRLIDGHDSRSYAATCGHTTVGADGAEESFLDDLRCCATVVRSGAGQVHPLTRPAFVLGSYGCDGNPADVSIEAVAPVLAQGGWVILHMHGVGAGTCPLFIDTDQHLRLIDWIAEHAEQLWSAPISAVAERLATLSA